MTSKVLCIIQARLGSSRLPSKVLEPIGDFPVLFHVVMRARHALPFAKVIVAAPRKDVHAMASICATQYFGWDGPENDVLGRFHAAVGLRSATTIVRLTADCPFVDPRGIKAVVEAVESGEADYAWTGDQVNGLDAEAFTPALLARAHTHAKDAYSREHVTVFMRDHAMRVFRYDHYDWLPRYRWTIDTAADLAWAREVAKLTDVTPPDPTPEKLHLLTLANPTLQRLDYAA